MYSGYTKPSYLGLVELNDFENELLKQYNNKQYDTFIISFMDRSASESGMDKDPQWPQASEGINIYIQKMISEGGKDAFNFFIKETMNDDFAKKAPQTFESISKVLDYVSKTTVPESKKETVIVEEKKEEPKKIFTMKNIIIGSILIYGAKEIFKI